MLRELLGLFYPRQCIGCNGELLDAETHLCSLCLYRLPRTNFHLKPDNALAKVFWGRFLFVEVYAFLYFRKEGLAQRILHQLKYKGNKELAEFMGTFYANEIKNHIVKPDAVIAIPLHKSKLKKRGYNQSEWFAKGIAPVLGIPDLSHTVHKVSATSTQTNKSRFERWQNVKEVFALKDVSQLENKRLLICDDVITTGATIEAFVNVLPASCKISICSIAFPMR